MIASIHSLCAWLIVVGIAALAIAGLSQLQGQHDDALSLLIVGAAIGVVAAVGFTITAKAEARQWH